MKEAQMNLMSVNIPSKKFGSWGTLVYLGKEERIRERSASVLVFPTQPLLPTVLPTVRLTLVLQDVRCLSAEPEIWWGVAYTKEPIRNVRGFLKRLARLIGKAHDPLSGEPEDWQRKSTKIWQEAHEL